MKKRTYSILTAVAGATAVLTCAAADARAATPEDKAAAEALFQVAIERLDQNDWDGACAKFAASQEMDPAVSTLVQLAKCREHEGKLAEAWYTLQEALKLNRDTPDQSPKRRDELETFARARLAELDPRVPRLRVLIRGDASGVVVTRNGKPVPASVLGEALPVDPGKHEAVATAQGFAPQKQSVTVGEGQTMDIVIELTPATTSLAPRASTETSWTPEPPAGDTASSGSGQRTAGFIAGAIGLAALATGGALGIATLVQNGNAAGDASGNADRDAARSTQTAAFVVAGVGLAALGAGTVLVLTAPSDSAGNASGAGASLVGRW